MKDYNINNTLIVAALSMMFAITSYLIKTYHEEAMQQLSKLNESVVADGKGIIGLAGKVNTNSKEIMILTRWLGKVDKAAQDGTKDRYTKQEHLVYARDVNNRLLRLEMVIGRKYKK